MAHDFSGRLGRARDAAERADVDALVITPSANLRYLCGYDPPPLERLTALVIRPSTEALLVVPRLEQPRAEASPAGGLIDMVAWPDGGDPYVTVRDLLGSATRVAVEPAMPATHLLGLQQALPAASFASAAPVMASLRVRKDDGEIDALARVGAADDDAFARICKERLEGRTEEDVARSLRGHMVDAGHDEPSFWIVGSGPSGASPHHEPSDRVLGAGEPVVLDFGGRMDGYCSDMTRTVTIGDPSDPQVREVHAIVADAQQRAFEAVRPGVPAQDVDRAARRVIEEGGYGHAFFHRTGHGIGLDTHENPYTVEGNEELLEPGMCFSIEPGIYLAGRFGVRIEDIVVVTEDGARCLHEAPRDLPVLF
jgi:Xaa-Pro aminopeptidase